MVQLYCIVITTKTIWLTQIKLHIGVTKKYIIVTKLYSYKKTIRYNNLINLSTTGLFCNSRLNSLIYISSLWLMEHDFLVTVTKIKSKYLNDNYYLFLYKIPSNNFSFIWSCQITNYILSLKIIVINTWGYF